MSLNPIIQCSQLMANTSPFKYCGEALDFNIEQGAITVLTGADNMGKNDWMKTLSGIYYPLSGTINFFGSNALQFDSNERGLLRKKLAYVTEELSLMSMLSGIANVMLPAHYHRLADREQIRVKALDLISRLGVKSGLDRLPADMHKDERFLLSIARALMLNPEALFLEKPFAMLDAVSEKQFKQFLLHKAKQDNMSIIVSTQDFDFISQYADRILLITQEKLFSFAGSDDFLNCNNTIVAEFIRKANH
ncbi:MAG: ATP-binding cassette domain-containing protein [gamma proteobacterium symbiont of Taylorina sp.]|nr:ATP-binding cassette domain-containing protein [gamma proteobacterium symbiont of Taylorina sp.]